jgi:hypothetical protein
MPSDACVFFFECPNCQARLQLKAGNCCVFFSYGEPMSTCTESAGRLLSAALI